MLVALSEDPSALPVSLAAVGIALSFLSHLLLDSLATRGIWPARPGGRGLAFPLVKEGRVPESLISLPVTLALLVALVPTLLTAVSPLVRPPALVCHGAGGRPSTFRPKDRKTIEAERSPALHDAYPKAKMDDLRTCEGTAVASPTAREDRSAMLGALVDLGLPENAYVRDPSRPRSALYLYRDERGRHDVGSAPWRLARHAPAGTPPEDVRKVGRELRRGLLLSLSGVAVACLGALLALVLIRPFVPEVPPESVSPAAYLHATPAIFGCVAVLCFVADLWHFVALLFPRNALAEDAKARAARGRPGGRSQTQER